MTLFEPIKQHRNANGDFRTALGMRLFSVGAVGGSDHITPFSICCGLCTCCPVVVAVIQRSSQLCS